VTVRVEGGELEVRGLEGVEYRCGKRGEEGGDAVFST